MTDQLKTFYMSFADVKLPEGQRFLGACLVKAYDMEHATKTAWIMGCNPGGGICFVEPEYCPPDKWYNRLLNREELAEMEEEVIATYHHRTDTIQ